MRKLRFRAWSFSESKFYTRVLVGYPETDDPCSCVWDDEKKDWVNFDKSCGIIQQFTGLKDSKGVDIYEGDIIKYTIKPNQFNFDIANKDFFADVVWHEYTLSFGCITKCKYTDLSEDTFCSFGDLIRHMESFEVVGNIFELPCKPDHNGECMVCDCWLSDCPLRK